MKEYKLSGWPELQAPFHRTCFTRMLSDMSHRYVSFAQLATNSTASRQEVRMFLEMLTDRGLLRERITETDSIFNGLRPLGNWIRRSVGSDVRKH